MSIFRGAEIGRRGSHKFTYVHPVRVSEVSGESRIPFGISPQNADSEPRLPYCQGTSAQSDFHVYSKAQSTESVVRV